MVDELLGRGRLAAVVDVHHYDDPEPPPFSPTSRRRLAERYRDRSPALAFDLLNEPRMPPEEWNELARGRARRGARRGRRAARLIGPAAAGTLEALDALRVPADDHLELTIHYYGSGSASPTRARCVGAGRRDLARHRPGAPTPTAPR